jgi:hypothetical protein
MRTFASLRATATKPTVAVPVSRTAWAASFSRADMNLLNDWGKMRTGCFALGVLLGVAGCSSNTPRVDTTAAATAPAFTAQNLRMLGWLEGKWRGTLPDGKPFFEGYRVLNDSTIAKYDYPDALATTPSDSGLITLRAGRITSGSGAMIWGVTQLSDGFVRFDPVQGARNSFVWRRTSAAEWIATLMWPATTNRPAGEVVYVMKRMQ